MDVKDKKICFILDDSNIRIFDKVIVKIKELKKLKAQITTIIKSDTKQNITSFINEIKKFDLVVIAPCSRQQY